MDILFIEKLIVMAYIGIYDWEKKFLQKLIFDVQLGYEPKSKHLGNNDKTFYINYIDVSNTILNLVNEKQFFLIEDVADIVANILIKQFNILWTQIIVSKPQGITGATNVGICIKRNKW
ncbi:FolB domain-containing protein [Candidatus Blochmannia ocreatus (nom. nud.)]|uniref:dihydroneopterin aldolase n=1 Tax=Candidatus Blochmannia ocreatus (nom. nud.) TaxID=251538 RepID=A0ABY4SUR2_9ENTR|nr:FolB domain-containing protein [Candidatus Blochmannia ocreatus]URJ25149.1 FolB domain-containing protein [Candidatus Blochmannia ocreatus]